MSTITNLAQLLHHLQPVRNPGVYVFVQEPLRHVIDAADTVASIREPQGRSLIVAESVAA